MIIAIDGPAGAGKSTVARELAGILGLRFLDTGAMYRAVTLVALGREVQPTDGNACADVARAMQLDFDEAGHVRVGGRGVEPAIRGAEVTAAVSAVSAHPAVREAVVAVQRALAARWGGAVAEGRDTTTVVFPDADHKFFLNASPPERARRRARELGVADEPAALSAVQARMEERDRLDSTRAASPLREAPDALRVETDGLAVSEVVARLAGIVRSQ